MARIFVSRVSYVTPPRTRRTVIEAAMVLAPWAYRVIGDLIMRALPPCRLRRAIVRAHTLSGWAAISRRDYKLTFVRYMRDVEYQVDGGFQMLGLAASVRDRDAMAAALAEWSESWEWWGLEPFVMIDMGNRLLGLGRFKARGLTSGIEIDEEYAQLITIRPGTGMVMREHDFVDWELGLLAAGLEPSRFASLLEDLSQTARNRNGNPRRATVRSIQSGSRLRAGTK
jgi:hypothetical protein